ncbi:MAG TPA: GNAT family N-acetyltransferase [Candidatus Angelobacter sp.]|nr:GNAT family N-acetyltransferase [Candidatus Angelobacter sp.]
MFPLKLLPYEPAFLQSFIEWRNQPLSVRHNHLKEMTKDEIAKMLEMAGNDLSDLRKYESYRWFVAADGEGVVGSVSLKNISHSMGYGEIGYGFAESHHGKGIATAAVRLLMEKIFRETNLRKLLAYVHEENIASCRVLEKLGFQEEGLLREHYLILGTPVNEILYRLLKHEWTGA